MPETLSQPGTHPDTGLYHVDHMPMPEDPVVLAVRQKQLAGDQLTIAESMHAGRDTTQTEIVEELPWDTHVYSAKPDHAYRAVNYDAVRSYMADGQVTGFGEKDEYEPGNNLGVDWFLGGTALRYGEVVLETPADPAYFQPAQEQGALLAKDPKIRHMKSSGHANPVPWDRVNVVQG